MLLSTVSDSPPPVAVQQSQPAETQTVAQPGEGGLNLLSSGGVDWVLVAEESLWSGEFDAGGNRATYHALSLQDSLRVSIVGGDGAGSIKLTPKGADEVRVFGPTELPAGELRKLPVPLRSSVPQASEAVTALPARGTQAARAADSLPPASELGTSQLSQLVAEPRGAVALVRGAEGRVAGGQGGFVEIAALPRTGHRSVWAGGASPQLASAAAPPAAVQRDEIRSDGESQYVGVSSAAAPMPASAWSFRVAVARGTELTFEVGGANTLEARGTRLQTGAAVSPAGVIQPADGSVERSSVGGASARSAAGGEAVQAPESGYRSSGERFSSVESDPARLVDRRHGVSVGTCFLITAGVLLVQDHWQQMQPKGLSKWAAWCRWRRIRSSSPGEPEARGAASKG